MDHLKELNFIKNQKEKLETKLKRLEQDIETVTENKNGNYKPIFPNLGSNDDDNAQEVQIFEDNISIESNLEEMIKRTKTALEKIENGKYGLCETCKEPISKVRLEAFPEAEYCTKHAK